MHSDAFLFTPSFAVYLKSFLDNTPAFSIIIPGWKSVFRPLLKSDSNPLSGIPVRSPLTTWPEGGFRNGESAQEQED